MKEMWDKRYSTETYAYGVEPNDYFKNQIQNLQAKKILLPAEGEGRNAVYAAKLGWEVVAFDLSLEGKNKAEKLAKANEVQIDYQVTDLNDTLFEANSFDAIGLIYAHFQADKRSAYHKLLNQYLKKDGIIIFEAFSLANIKLSASNAKPMGPQLPEMLFTIDDIKKDFENYEIIELKEDEVLLSEGEFHIGRGALIRFVGRKMY